MASGVLRLILVDRGPAGLDRARPAAGRPPAPRQPPAFVPARVDALLGACPADLFDRVVGLLLGCPRRGGAVTAGGGGAGGGGGGGGARAAPAPAAPDP